MIKTYPLRGAGIHCLNQVGLMSRCCVSTSGRHGDVDHDHLVQTHTAKSIIISIPVQIPPRLPHRFSPHSQIPLIEDCMVSLSPVHFRFCLWRYPRRVFGLLCFSYSLSCYLAFFESYRFLWARCSCYYSRGMSRTTCPYSLVLRHELLPVGRRGIKESLQPQFVIPAE